MAKYRVVGKMGTKGRRVVDPEGRPLSRPKSRSKIAGGSSYTIRRGDTLSGIARRLGTTVSKLMAMNPQIKDANKIRAGAKLNIKGTPSGARSAAAARVTKGPSRQEQIAARKKKTKARQAEMRKAKEEATKGKRPFTPQAKPETTTALAGKSGPRVIKRKHYTGGKGTQEFTGEESAEQGRIRKKHRGKRGKSRDWRDYLRSLRR